MSRTDQDKTKAQLISELDELRRKMATLEKMSALSVGGAVAGQALKSVDADRGNLEAQVQSECGKRRLVEERLSPIEQLYRALFEQASDGIFILDTQGRIVSVNDSFARMHGFTVEEMLRLGLEGLDVEGSAPVAERIRRIMAGEFLTFEVQHYHKDGHTFPLEVKTNLISLGSEQLIIAIHRDIGERKRAEEALQLSEARHSAILSSMNDIVFEIDLNGCFTGYHAPISKRLYVPPEHFLGKRFDEVLPENVCVLLRQSIEQVYSGNPFYQFEYILSIDNTIQWEHAVVTPRYNASNEIIGMTAVCRDITDRKLAQQELINSEQRFRNIVESSPLGIYMYDLADDGRLVFSGFNSSADRILGVDHSGFIGKTIEEAFPPLANTEVPESYREAARNGTAWRTEEIDYDDNQGISGAFEVTAFQTSPGRMVAMFSDITERKRAKEALRRSEEQLRVVTENAPDAIMQVNDKGEIIFVNRLLPGLTREQVIGSSIYQWVPEEQHPVLDRAFREVFRTGELQQYESLFSGPDGIQKTYNVRVGGVKVEGKVISAIYFATDVSDRKRAEEAVSRSEARYRDIVENAPIGIFRREPGGKFQYVNPGLIRQLECKTEKELLDNYGLISQRWVSSEKSDEFNALLLKNRRVYGYETETQLVDGTTKWFALYSFLDDSDQLIYGFSLDITDHKQAEGRIQRERDQAQMYLDTAGVILVALDRSGDIILANRKCCQILDQHESDLIGQPWFDTFVLPESREEVKKIFGQLMAGRMDRYIEHYENDLITGSGQRRTISWHNTIMRDRQGNIVGSFSSGEDVTEQRKAEARLVDEQAETRRLLEFQELVLNNMGSGILVTDTYGEIILANPQAQRILGATGRVLDGTILSDLVPGLSAMLDPGYQSDEIRLVLADGRAVVLGFNRNPIRDEELNPVGMVVIFQDITAFQKAQEALRESEARVQRKLQSIVSPEEDIGDLELEDIINVLAIQQLMDKFYDLTGVPVAVIDLQGKVLVGTGWQDICTKFHRVHPETLRNCIECDTALTRGIPPGTFKTYICENGLRDCATPLMVGGKHVGNLFTGQFFFRGDKPDDEFFLEQAERYGFEKQAYMKAMRKVPVWDQEVIDVAFEFYARLAGMISELSHRNIVLARLLEERKQAEEKLLEISQWLAMAQRAANSGFWNWDLVTGKLTWSSEFFELFGLDPRLDPSFELWRSRVHPDDLEGAEGNISQSIKDRVPLMNEYRIVLPDGHVVWILAKGVTTYEGSGQPIRMSGICLDITARKLAEEKLREREETYRALVEGIPDIVMRFDEFGRHVFVSRNMDELVDIPAREFIGRTPRELGFDENLCRFFETAIQRVFASGYPLETEFSILGKHGLVIFNWRLIPETDQAGRTHTVLTIAHDVTDKKRVEAEKEDLQRRIAHTQKLQAIGTLAGGIAHDFNNILGVIIGNSELLLQSDQFTDDESRTDIKLVLDAGLRGRHLVRQILAFSRKEQVEKQPVDINLIAKETAKMLKSLIPSTIRFKWNLSATPSRVLADPTQLQQVLINLASNAADAVGEDGEIVLTVSREVVDSETPLIQAGIKPGEYISVQFRDNGSGIAPAMLDRIFEPFFTTKPPGKGTGLGLAVVHGIVTSHGGAIGVRSNPGQGTTFTVYLPPVEDEVLSHDLSSAQPSMQGAGRILLVDDEASVLRTMERILGRLGFEITSYNSSTDALHDFRHSPQYHDLVISDVVMPNLNGERLAREILAIRPEVPIILYSGSVPSDGIVRLQQTARVGFISKPIGIRELFDVIREMMKANCNSRPGG